jgi:hypothetical protein
LQFIQQVNPQMKWNTMNKLAHTLILAVFGVACWFLWAILTLTTIAAHGEALPAFTTLCVGLRPVMFILPALSAVYCLWLWFRKIERLPSWISFFAVTTSVLILLALPTLIAAYLPLIKAVNHLASK